MNLVPSSKNLCLSQTEMVNHVFTHKHTELPAFSFSIMHCSVCSQARTYQIKYIDRQFLLSQNCSGQLAVGILPLYCKYTFLSFLKMLNALTTVKIGGGGGGGGMKEKGG